MIKVSVLYPRTSNSTFDKKYYLERHVPMVQGKLGDAVKGAAIDEGLAGGSPGQAPTFSIMTHLLFESVDAFQSSFGPHAEAIMADIPNFSSEQPTIQINNVLA